MMNQYSRFASNRLSPHIRWLALATAVTGASGAKTALAQPAEEAPTAAEAPPPTPPTGEEVPATEPVPDAAPVTTPEPEPLPVEAEKKAPPPETPTAEEPPPEEKPKEFEPSLVMGAGVRTGLNLGLNGPVQGQLRLDDGLVDQVNIRPFIGGNLTSHVGFWAQLELGTPNGLGSFSILDAIAQIRFIDEVQLWVGHHIPANDRNNMNGPFFANGWNFPIAVEEYPFDTGARDRGFTLWGLIAGGVVKYHLSMVDLQPGNDIEQSRFAARVTVHLLEPEAFYYNSGTYWGEKDVLAIGAVTHGQDGDNGMDNDFFGFSLDAFFEKNTGAAGTFTAELGYWNFDETGANYLVNQNSIDTGLGVPLAIFPSPYPGEAGLGKLSWLTPSAVGPGKIQVNGSVQYADWAPDERIVIDAGLTYVVDGFNHKYHFNYRHADTNPSDGTAGTSSDMIQLGVQYMMAR